MSVGKKSLARVANAAVQKAEIAETIIAGDEKKIFEDAEDAVAETLDVAAEISAPEKENIEKFKNVQIGDDMPAFLL